MKSYLFGKRNKPHMFCPECGSSILIDFKDSDDPERRDWMAVNVSALSSMFIYSELLGACASQGCCFDLGTPGAPCPRT